MINLNKTLITKRLLLKYLTDLEIFQKYTNEEIIPGKIMLSPLRKESNSSFNLFKGEDGELYFKDFVLGGGDCIKFVQMKFNLNYFEALSKIAIDFNMEDDFIVRKNESTTSSGVSNITPIDRSEFLHKSGTLDLKKTKREWKSYDLLFWDSYGISLDTLNKFNVEPIQYFFINDRCIKADKYAYCFKELKDNKETYKIYQPFNQNYKWINSHNNSVWQGWCNLPEKGDILIITKSLKDVMSIYEATGLPAVSMQCENVLPKTQVFDELKHRFEDIYIFYDNDFDKEENWGKIFAEKFKESFDVYQIEIDDKYECKDFSDFVKKYGIQEARKMINSQIIPF
jgi:hypothetical protein